MKIKVGAAALNTTPIGWKWNFEAVLEAIGLAQQQNVQLLCLPELCLTGYGCEDLFFRTHVQRRALASALELAKQTAECGMVLTVGLPLEHRGGLYNVVAVLSAGKIRGFYAKQNLAGNGVHYEPRWFKAWPQKEIVDYVLPDGTAVPLGDTTFELSAAGEKASFGFEICEDAWVAERPGIALSKAAVDIILNPSASHFAFGKTRTRERSTRAGGLIRCRARRRSAWHVRTSGPVPFLRSVLLSLAVPPAVRPAGRASRGAPLEWNPSTPALDTDSLPGAARALRASTAKALRLHFAAWRGGRCTSRPPS